MPTDNVLPLPVPLLSPDEVRPRSADAIRLASLPRAAGAAAGLRANRCTATARGTGERCKAWAVQGTTVCRSHGGALPNVRAAADAKLEEYDVKRRIDDLVPKALATMERLVTDAQDDKTALAASKDVLDRSGHGAPNKIEVGGPGAFMHDVDAQIERILSRGEAEEAG